MTKTEIVLVLLSIGLLLYSWWQSSKLSKLSQVVRNYEDLYERQKEIINDQQNLNRKILNDFYTYVMKDETNLKSKII